MDKDLGDYNFTLKINGGDVYKAVKNFIKNGLGLKKEDIIQEIKNQSIDFAKEALNETLIDKKLNEEINNRIYKALNSSFGWNYQDSLKEYIERKINEEIKKCIAETIKEKITVQFKTGEFNA